MRQVQENQESAKRQYGLRERALELGWPAEQIVIIDCDQGQSASSAVEREGFQRLMTEVSMNRAGIVMGLEVSRLARNSSDWHRLLEIWALTRTLLLDDDGLYDPAHFNDRLRLGLKGTLSEAALYVIRARLRGGLLQKARRGELGGRLPTGLAYGPNGQVELDPDRQVRESFQHLFRTFERTGSALGVVKAFHQEGLKFPRRVCCGPQNGDLVWDKLTYTRVAWILSCPRYAGAYAYGRSRSRKLPNGRIQRTKKKFRRPSGMLSFPTLMRAISVGSSSKPTRKSFRKTPPPAAVNGNEPRRGKDRRCSRGWLFAANADGTCTCATASSASNSIRIMSAAPAPPVRDSSSANISRAAPLTRPSASYSWRRSRR